MLSYQIQRHKRYSDIVLYKVHIVQCASQGQIPISSPPSGQRGASPQRPRPRAAGKPSPASRTPPHPRQASPCGHGPRRSQPYWQPWHRGDLKGGGDFHVHGRILAASPVRHQDVSWAPVVARKEETTFLHWSQRLAATAVSKIESLRALCRLILSPPERQHMA